MAEPESDDDKNNFGPGHLGPEKFQSVVRWIIMLFLGYVLVHNALGMKSGSVLPPPATLPATTMPVQQTENKKDSDCDKKFPLFNVNLLPLYVPAVKTEEIKTGSGEPAACGQKAVFLYEYSVHNKVLEKGKKTIVIGDGTALHGAEIGMIGMKPGGVRKVSMSPQLSDATSTAVDVPDNIKNRLTIAKLSLEKLSPSLPSPPLPLRAIDMDIGSDREVQCGDRVSINISLWKVDGTPLNSPAKPVSFVIGQSALPYGIEEGVIGMRENGNRLIVIPPGGFGQPLIKNAASASAQVAIPQGEIVMAQIERLHIETGQDKEILNPFGTTPAAEKPETTQSKPKKPEPTKP